MGLKTEKTQKLVKQKRYYTEFGKLKLWNILNDLVLVVILPILIFFFLEVFYIFFVYKDFSILSNYRSYLDLTEEIFLNFFNLEKFGIAVVFYYYIITVVTFWFLFLMYLFYQLKKADNLAKLSSLGLEGYKVKKRKNGLLFLAKRGEELDFKKFKDENLENIRQVFNKIFGEDDEIVVERWKNRGFYLKKVKLNVKEFEPNMLKKGEIFFGRGLKNGNIYLNIEDLTHFLVVGQSGAGKSVFQNLLINQFIYNIDNGISQLYLVDLKGGVEFLQYSKFKNVNVITDVKQLYQLSKELIDLMDDRYRKMIERGWKNWKGDQIIVLIDEYASVNDQADLLEKEDAKRLKNNLRTLLAKARAAGIKFLIATQKATSDSIDTTLRENLQSKILMRTVSKDAQKAVIPRENLEELGVQPAKFKKGRYVFFTEKILDLVQSPYIQEDFYKKIEEIRRDLVQNYLEVKEDKLKNDNGFEDKKNLSCHEIEAEILPKNEDGEERGDEFLEQNQAEMSDNISPINYKKEEAIKLRKEMYKLTSKVKNKEKRKKMRDLIRRIKEQQESGVFNYKIEDLKAMKKFILDEIGAEAETTEQSEATGTERTEAKR